MTRDRLHEVHQRGRLMADRRTFLKLLAGAAIAPAATVAEPLPWHRYVRIAAPHDALPARHPDWFDTVMEAIVDVIQQASESTPEDLEEDLTDRGGSGA